MNNYLSDNKLSAIKSGSSCHVLLGGRSCFEAFTENMAGETQLLELRRQLHCAAYSCAIALICCSFNETKFYQGFLFTEKPEKVRAAKTPR